MQLELLDLLIEKENGAVPRDAAVRAELIDLMARVGEGLHNKARVYMSIAGLTHRISSDPKSRGRTLDDHRR
jgi:hypothetical protein